MTTPATETKRRRSRERTRQRLLEAALSVFAKNGFERATVDEIVREAGFSKGAFYVHFETKDDLFWELLEERIVSQQDILRAAIDPGLGVEENERRILNAVFETRRNDPLSPAIFLEFVAHASRNEKVRERLAHLYERWHSFIMDALKQGREAGLVRSDVDLDVLASATMAVLEGTFLQLNVAPRVARLNEHVDELAKLLTEWVAPK
jgi:AcrR family transcriptional regulator